MLQDRIAALEPHAGRNDFVVCTYPIVKQLNELVLTLMEAPDEGNSRAILRQLRNTFLNGGWNRYRDGKARQIAMSVLNYLTRTKQVPARKVDETFDQLYDNGLNPVALPLPDIQESPQTTYAQRKVSD
jgi:hypothetical protein